MNRSKMRIFAIPALLACLALLALGYEVSNSRESNQLPRSGWKVGFHSYRAVGFDSIPVRVTSVTSEGNKGLTKVVLQNRSSKSVAAVKIGWYVSSDTGQGAILAKGESALLALPSALNADENLHFNVPPVSLFRILKPVMKGKTLTGAFSVQVVVTEIVYADESTWQFAQPDNVARIQFKYAHAPAGCAGQTCKWNSGIQSYTCEPGPGELCTNSGDSCTSSACGAEQND